MDQKDLADRIIEPKPVPAGGAAAAYTCVLGLALTYKTIAFELNRKGSDPAAQAGFREAEKELERLYLDLRKATREDPDLYLKYNQALKSEDQAAMKSSFLDIVTGAMNTMDRSMQGLDWLKRLAPIVNPSLATNLIVAMELLYSGIMGTAHVVRANLKMLKSEFEHGRYRQNLVGVCRTATQYRAEALETLAAKLGAEIEHDEF
jgi:formiminotetrahydrofolate cyclodeaminase